MDFSEFTFGCVLLWLGTGQFNPCFSGLCLVICLYPWSNPKWYCWMGHINPVWPSGAIQCHRSAINWTSVDLSSLGFCGIHRRPISQEVPTMSIRKMSLKNTLIKLLPRWQWVNALTTHNIPPRKQSTTKRYAYSMGCSQVHGRYVCDPRTPHRPFIRMLGNPLQTTCTCCMIINNLKFYFISYTGWVQTSRWPWVCLGAMVTTLPNISGQHGKWKIKKRKLGIWYAESWKISTVIKIAWTFNAILRRIKVTGQRKVTRGPFTGPLFRIKLYLLLLTRQISKLRGVLRCTESAVPGKFHGSGGHSKRNCLHAPANFHRSRGHGKLS